MADPADTPDQDYIDSQMFGDDDGLCDCGKTMWDDCDCGAFFEQWLCGMGPDGQCSMAGSEDCDFECPVMAGRRSACSAPSTKGKAHDRE